MKELSIKEEKTYYGGGGITASLVDALSRGFNVILDAGRYLGSALRRIFSHNMC